MAAFLSEVFKMQTKPEGATHKFKTTGNYYKITGIEHNIDKYAMFYSERHERWCKSKFKEKLIVENKKDYFEKV